MFYTPNSGQTFLYLGREWDSVGVEVKVIVGELNAVFQM